MQDIICEKRSVLIGAQNLGIKKKDNVFLTIIYLKKNLSVSVYREIKNMLEYSFLLRQGEIS